MKYLGIKAVVFTNNTEVKTLCNYMKVSTAPVPEVNVYGMPVLRSMVSTARQYYSNDYVMYIKRVKTNKLATKIKLKDLLR